jgi:Tat protein translocase TatB subunit
MFGVSFLELVVIFLIGLIVLGPERLPRVANQLGKWIGQARRMTRVMKRQLEEELNFDDELNIRPPARTRHANLGTYKPPGPAVAAVPESPVETLDDTYSPQHAGEAVGTGVGDEIAADHTAQPGDDAAGPAGEKRPE